MIHGLYSLSAPWHKLRAPDNGIINPYVSSAKALQAVTVLGYASLNFLSPQSVIEPYIQHNKAE